MYAPEGVANPRTPIVGRTFFCSERGDKVRPALETEWDVVAGKRMRLERCTTREMVRALADAVFREGIMVSDKGLDCMLGPSARWLRVFGPSQVIVLSLPRPGIPREMDYIRNTSGAHSSRSSSPSTERGLIHPCPDSIAYRDMRSATRVDSIDQYFDVNE